MARDFYTDLVVAGADQRVVKLFRRLAGDEFESAAKHAISGHKAGLSIQRSMAETLFSWGLPTQVSNETKTLTN